MKELYTKPELNVDIFAAVDVMTASPDEQPGTPTGDGDDD